MSSEMALNTKCMYLSMMSPSDYTLPLIKHEYSSLKISADLMSTSLSTIKHLKWKFSDIYSTMHSARVHSDCYRLPICWRKCTGSHHRYQLALPGWNYLQSTLCTTVVPPPTQYRPMWSLPSLYRYHYRGARTGPVAPAQAGPISTFTPF